MRKSLLFISLGVLVVLSLVFATYFVLTKFSPQDEVRRMTITMSRLKTVTEAGGFHWTVTDGTNDIYTTLYTNGPMRLSDPTKWDHDTIFRSVLLSKSTDYKDISGEIKSLNGKIFLTYTPPGPTVSGVNFTSPQTWVSFEPGEFPSWGSLIPNLTFPFPITHSKTSWTPEAIKQLRVLLGLTDIFQVTYHGAEEEIRGEKTRVIDAWFDGEAFKTFLYDIIRAREKRDLTDQERLNMNTIATNLEHVSVRMWIGKKDHYLYRIQAVGGLPRPNSTQLMAMDLRIDFSEFNKSFDVFEPESFIPFKKIYQSLLQVLPMSSIAFGRSSSLPTVTQDASIPEQQIQTGNDQDHDGLDQLLEGFFGTNPNNADTDGDGVSDGVEVKRGSNPRGKGTLFGFGLGN